jgi:hypothetical protein
MPNNVARQCAHSPGLDSLFDARHASTNDEFMATDQERARTCGGASSGLTLSPCRRRAQAVLGLDGTSQAVIRAVAGRWYGRPFPVIRVSSPVK